MKFDRVWPKLQHMERGTLITTIRPGRNYNYWKSRDGHIEELTVTGKRWGAAEVHGVELRRFESLDIRLLRLDTMPQWSIEQIRAYFEHWYPGFTPQDKVTLIWLEVTAVDRRYRKKV